MKHTLAIILLALSLCASGMAQTKGKPVLPQQARASTVTSFDTGSTSLDNLIFSGRMQPVPPPITIDGETADCTTPHLVKALKIAAAMIADPNEQPCMDCYSTVFLTSPQGYTNYPYRQKPADEKRAQAERLKAEADGLESESRRVQWVRAVLAGCDK